MRKYDVTVVGAGLGGLAVAALLANKRKKAIILERSASMDAAVGVLKRDGFAFSVAPAISHGFEPGGELHDFCERLGIVQEISVHSPCYQVALPDRRITCFAESGDTLEELRREFPGEIDALKRFYNEVHKKSAQNTKSRLSSYMSKRTNANGLFRKYRFSPELLTFFDVQSRYFYQKPLETLSVAELITICSAPPRYLHGGFKKLADQLYGIILRQGGEISYNETVSGLAMKNDRVVGVNTARGVVEAGTLLLNRMQQQPSPTLFMGMRNDVVPIGMCRQVLFLPDYAQPHDFISLSLNAEDDAAAPSGMRALNATYRAHPARSIGKQALLERVSALIPFLNDHLVFADEYLRGDEDVTLPDAIAFHPLRSKDGAALLFQGSKKQVFLLENEQNMPLQAISAAQRFVKKQG